MSFAFFPLAILLLFIGFNAQMYDNAQAISGAGEQGYMQTLARVRAQQLSAFAMACQAQAVSQPGVISSGLAVSMPLGANIPAGAVCLTTAAATGGRNVYAWMPAVGGMAAAAYDISQYNASWYNVTASGVAANMVTGQTSAIPASITSPAVVNWTQVNP